MAFPDTTVRRTLSQHERITATNGARPDASRTPARLRSTGSDVTSSSKGNAPDPAQPCARADVPAARANAAPPHAPRRASMRPACGSPAMRPCRRTFSRC